MLHHLVFLTSKACVQYLSLQCVAYDTREHNVHRPPFIERSNPLASSSASGSFDGSLLLGADLDFSLAGEGALWRPVAATYITLFSFYLFA